MSKEFGAHKAQSRRSGPRAASDGQLTGRFVLQRAALSRECTPGKQRSVRSVDSRAPEVCSRHWRLCVREIRLLWDFRTLLRPLVDHAVRHSGMQNKAGSCDLMSFKYPRLLCAATPPSLRNTVNMTGSGSIRFRSSVRRPRRVRAFSVCWVAECVPVA